MRRAVGGGSGPKIAVVTATGTIMRGENAYSLDPLLGGEIMGSETICRALRDARRLAGVRAVVFRVDSPGGTPLASEMIRRELVRTAEQVPVVVSYAGLGASGGYWIGCGAQRVVADPASLVGSIGVVAGQLDLSGFLSNKLGVTFGRLDFGSNANLYSMLEGWSDAQRAIISRILDRTYDHFLEIVADARGMTTEEVDALGQGRVFTGEQAAANGLVDAVGGFDVALDEARGLAGLAPAAPVRLVDFPERLPWWRQLMDHRRRDEVALGQALEAVQRGLRGDALGPPGTVWMPPVTVE
jgi:protease-4